MSNVDTFKFTTKACLRVFKQALVTLLVASCGVKTEGQTPFKTLELRHCPTDLISDAMYVGTDVTITKCVEMCALRPWCVALIYRRQYPLCELFSKSGLIVHNTTETAGYCQYVDEDNFSAKFVQLRLECSTLANTTCPEQYVACDMDNKQCIKPECPRLNVTNGVLLGNMNNNGTRKQVTCNPDYIVESGASITTCIDGNWNPYPQCIKLITCENPKPVLYASMSYSGLAPGSTVAFTCEPGYIMVSGDAVRTCHESGGWTGTQPKCQVQNCVTLQNNATGKLKSGLYQINRGGRNFHIYCNYGDGDGYVYISTSIPSDVDLNMASLSDDSSHVKVIHRRQNGSQYEAKIQQIAAFNTLPVSVQFNKHDGYKGVQNTAMGPYVFTGFVPLSVNPKHGTQGWKVNGNEVTFTNCDGNLNSYFAVLLNANKADYTLNNGGKNSLMYAWYELATPVSDLLPEAIFSPNYEIHHGGCGGYSTGKTERDVTGVTIGQRFIITCSEPDDVRDATKTFGDVKPGSVVTYVCNPGYTSSGDLMRTCTPTGGWSGVQPTCTR